MQTEKFPMVGAPERAYSFQINRLPQCEGRNTPFDSVAVSFATPSHLSTAGAKDGTACFRGVLEVVL